jgi:hypothetical protein
MSIQVLQPGQSRTRKRRSPNFPIAGTMKPFGLYPLMCHPVLPGETLNSFNMKWRTLSKPVKHPLTGAWLDVWLVYVKLTDLSRDLGNMFIDDTYSTTGYTSAGSARYFTATGQIDWVKLCTERVHDAYFMDDSETSRTIDGVRQTKMSATSWYQNCLFKPVDDPLGGLDVGSDYAEMNAFMMMQQMNMSELTYEKYLEQYGVTSIRSAEGDPEILRYARSWTLPVNTVEPSTGVPSSAWTWSDEVKMDKDKRFSEPGFLLALASVRPKMYQKHQENSFVGNLWGFSDFFPAYTLEDPTAGIKTITSADKVYHANHRTDAGTVNLLYDHRDLLNHGEQFINNWTQPYSLPLSTGLTANDADDNAALRGEYALSADVDALFSSADAVDKQCYYEGMAHCVISGHIQDTTPRGR